MERKKRGWRGALDAGGIAVAGAIATGLDALTCALLAWAFPHAFDGRLGAAAFLGALAGGVLHFSLCRFVVLARFRAPIGRAALLYFAMSWAAAAIHGGLVQIGAAYLPGPAAWIAAKAILFLCWTWPMSRFVVFRPARQRAAEEAA